MRYYIFQLPASSNNIFRPLSDNTSYKISISDYVPVYTGEISVSCEDICSNEELCESLFKRFNYQLPEHFAGHSLSISDIIALRDEDIEVDGRIIEIETGIYFLKTTIHNPATGDLSNITYPSELILEAASKEQEEIAITTTLEELDPISSSDLSIFLDDYYAVGKGLDTTRWGRVADPLLGGLDALVNKSEIFEYNSNLETKTVAFSYNPLSIILPSVTDLYLSFTENSDTDDDPACVIIGTDINVSPDPEDPSYVISFPAGVYFPIYDMGHGEVEYASKLILQQEQHVESIVRKIEEKFLDENTFTIQVLQESDTSNHIMNKTWKEIHAAYQAGKSVYVQLFDYRNSEGASVIQAFQTSYDLDRSWGHYNVYFPSIVGNELAYSSFDFEYSSDDDYPIAYSSH